MAGHVLTHAVNAVRQRLPDRLDLDAEMQMLPGTVRRVDGFASIAPQRETRQPPRFHRVRAPTHAELQCLLHAIATRITRALERKGLLLRDDPSSVLDIESADDFDSLLAAAPLRSHQQADRIHNPRAPPSELAQRAEPLRAPAAELPVSPSPTVP